MVLVWLLRCTVPILHLIYLQHKTIYLKKWNHLSPLTLALVVITLLCYVFCGSAGFCSRVSRARVWCVRVVSGGYQYPFHFTGAVIYQSPPHYHSAPHRRHPRPWPPVPQNKMIHRHRDWRQQRKIFWKYSCYKRASLVSPTAVRGGGAPIYPSLEAICLLLIIWRPASVPNTRVSRGHSRRIILLPATD